MKAFKEEVEDVKRNNEFGIALVDFTDLQEGDVLEAGFTVQIAASIDDSFARGATTDKSEDLQLGQMIDDDLAKAQAHNDVTTSKATFSSNNLMARKKHLNTDGE